MIWRVAVVILSSAAGALLVFIAIIFFFITHQYCCSRFDPGEWKRAGQGTDGQVTKKEMECLRGRMLHDLRTMYLKRGMSTKELISLLGPFTRSIADRENNCYSYSVGYCGGLGFDLNVITFCFDAYGRLLDAQGKIGG